MTHVANTYDRLRRAAAREARARDVPVGEVLAESRFSLLRAEMASLGAMLCCQRRARHVVPAHEDEEDDGWSVWRVLCCRWCFEEVGEEEEEELLGMRREKKGERRGRYEKLKLQLLAQVRDT
jgi:hypothetical protein